MRDELMDDENYWPAKDDKAFKPDGNRATDVCIGYLPIFGLEDIVAESFKEAADMIVTTIEKDGPRTFVHAYLHPVGYLYRHYIELKLKNVLRGGLRLKQILVPDEVMHGHNLHKLWNFFRELVVEMK